MALTYENPSDQAAFNRWVDLMADLLQKYGPAFLNSQNERGLPILSMPDGESSSEIDAPLDEEMMAA